MKYTCNINIFINFKAYNSIDYFKRKLVFNIYQVLYSLMLFNFFCKFYVNFFCLKA